MVLLHKGGQHKILPFAKGEPEGVAPTRPLLCRTRSACPCSQCHVAAIDYEVRACDECGPVAGEKVTRSAMS
jgi:hypothetical protein